MTSKCMLKWKRTINPKTGIKEIQSGYSDGIWHRKMCHVNNEKRKTANDGRNRTTKSGKKQNPRRKRNLQVLGNIGSGDERKKN